MPGDPNLDLGLEYTGGINKPEPEQNGYVAIVDGPARNLVYVPPASLGVGGGGTPDDNSVSTIKIQNNAVTDAKLRDCSGLSVIGRSANSTGDPADIVAAGDGQVFCRNGTTIGFSSEPPLAERSSVTAPTSGTGKYWVRSDNGTDTQQRPVFTSEDARAEVLSPFPTHHKGLQTTNATITTAITYTMSDNTIISIGARFVARQASSNNMLFREVTAVYKRVGGGAATLLGAQIDGVSVTDDAAFSTTISTSTNDVLLRVTGKAATTINWEVEAWIQERALP